MKNTPTPGKALPSHETIFETFAHLASLHPSGICITDERRSLTYAQFLQLIEGIAKEIRPLLGNGEKARENSEESSGRSESDESDENHATTNETNDDRAPVGEDTPFIGVIMEHGIEQIATMFAILKCGAAYVPAEPDSAPDRVRFMMEECRVACIVTQESCLQSLPLEGFRTLLVEAGHRPAEQPNEQPISPRRVPQNDASKPVAEPASLAYVLYTSGTTGKPKGVMVEHRNVCNYARAFAHEYHPTSADTMLQYSVCTFDIFVEEVFATLLSGARLAIAPTACRGDLEALITFCESHEVTIISGFPYLLAEMNEQRRIPRTLRLAISGGDVLRANQVDWLVRQTEVYNTYGPSETTVCATYYRVNGTEPLENDTYPIGHAILGVQVAVIDEKGRPAPEGEMGEIAIGGAGVSRGYLGGRHAESFITLPDGARWYLSGDMGYRLSDGNLVFSHRKDSQVMIYGKRVEPEEVENVLCACPGIESGVVVARTDEAGFPYLCAYVATEGESDATLSIESIERFLSKSLLPHMIPESFVRLKEIPLTSNGKPDVKALPTVKRGCSQWDIA